MQADGRILVAGSIPGATWDMGVMRYEANGTIDTTFGAGGLATLDFGGDDYASGAACKATARS